jgi:hypothetical protein
MKPSTFGRIAGLTFAAEAVFPIAHRAAGAWYGGLTHSNTVAVDVGLAVIWIASAVVGLVQPPGRAYFVLLVGTAVTLIHFVLFSVSTGVHGPRGVALPWLVLFPLQAYWVLRAAPAFWNRGEEPAAGAEPAPERGRWLPLRPRHG